MGLAYNTYLNSSKIYGCKNCKAHLSNHEDIISRVSIFAAQASESAYLLAGQREDQFTLCVCTAVPPHLLPPTSHLLPPTSHLPHCFLSANT